jgi:hypothetical protein
MTSEYPLDRLLTGCWKKNLWCRSGANSKNMKKKRKKKQVQVGEALLIR